MDLLVVMREVARRKGSNDTRCSNIEHSLLLVCLHLSLFLPAILSFHAVPAMSLHAAQIHTIQ
jgi:hypothetical protein